jgi:hypothetical protein
MLFQKILFPVDFSTACERAAPPVAAMQKATGPNSLFYTLSTF